MTIKEDSMIHELKSRIKLLEKQYAPSSGDTNEKLLLWLASESIYQSDSIPDLINNLLDRIAALLEIPYCSCCEISKNELSVIQQFPHNTQNSDTTPTFQLRKEIFEALKEGYLIVSKEDPLFSKIQISGISSADIREITLYPFQSIAIPYGVFIFSSSKKASFCFEAYTNALHYLVNIAVEKIEKLSLSEELKELNRVFEIKLNERTVGLQQQLGKMKSELETLKKKKPTEKKINKGQRFKKDRSLEYLKNVGVEVRTPLNGILGFSDLLRNAACSPVEKENYIDIIRSCGKSILKIVNDAVELSSIEQESRHPMPDEINLGEFMSELYDQFTKDELLQQRKGLDLKLNMKISAGAKINADVHFLSQILSNLIGNAIKFTSHGTIEIGCQLVEQKSEVKPSGIRFFVKDTGVGVQNEFQEKIFDRFYKIDHEIAKLYGGLGLGLPIAKILIEKMGGAIGFESQEGKGSEFFFTLPPTLIVPGSLVVNGQTGFVQTHNWEGKRILIVEDDKMSLIYLQEVLKSTKAELIYVADGKTAIDMVKNDTNLDLILMDIKLPGITGYEATEIIRRFSNIPIIAQTAYAMADDYKRMLQVGCDDYISKPINRLKLLLKIKSIFELRK